jgi:predicted nucleic acid-binding protein
MVLAYFDSSLLLSFLLRENKAEDARAIWQKYDVRVSSSLLKIETNIVLRRNYKQVKNNPNNFSLENRLEELNNFFGDIFFRDIDMVFREPYINYDRISNCRSLDAIHIATALDIRNKSKCEVRICTFDNNMIEITKQFGFDVN